MLTLIEIGEVYSPKPRSATSVLLVDGRIGVIGVIGPVDRRALERVGLVERGLAGWDPRSLDHGADPARLTASSDDPVDLSARPHRLLDDARLARRGAIIPTTSRRLELVGEKE